MVLAVDLVACRRRRTGAAALLRFRLLQVRSGAIGSSCTPGGLGSDSGRRSCRHTVAGLLAPVSPIRGSRSSCVGHGARWIAQLRGCSCVPRQPGMQQSVTSGNAAKQVTTPIFGYGHQAAFSAQEDPLSCCGARLLVCVIAMCHRSLGDSRREPVQAARQYLWGLRLAPKLTAAGDRRWCGDLEGSLTASRGRCAAKRENIVFHRLA